MARGLYRRSGISPCPEDLGRKCNKYFLKASKKGITLVDSKKIKHIKNKGCRLNWAASINTAIISH
jgi:hypothetical protein